jgi:hypothetical protein
METMEVKYLLDLQLLVQSVSIITDVVILNPAHGKVYSIQHYVIKFVCDLWQVCGILWVIQFPHVVFQSPIWPSRSLPDIPEMFP